MPRISTSVVPSSIETTAMLAAAEQKTETSSYRNRDISVSKNKSIKSLLKAAGRGISAGWSSLFKGKRAAKPEAAAGETAQRIPLKRIAIEREPRVGAPHTVVVRAEVHAMPPSTVQREEMPQKAVATEEKNSPAPALQADISADNGLLAEAAMPVVIDLPAATEMPPAVAPSEPESIPCALPDEAVIDLQVVAPAPGLVRQLRDRIESSQSSQSTATPPRYAPRDRGFRSVAYRAGPGRFNVTGTGIVNAEPAPEFTYSALRTFIASARANPELSRRLEAMGMAPARTLANAAAQWYPSHRQEEVLAAWRDAAPENTQGMKALSAFLNKLGQTQLEGKTLKHNASVNAFVQAWLTQLADSPELLEETGNVAYGATQTCADRVLLTFNQMQTPRVFDDVKSGKYDGRLPDLVTAGRRQLRLEHLENIAAAEVEQKLSRQMRSPAQWLPSIPAQQLAGMSEADIKARLRANSEELETHLYMQVGNIKSLDLELPIGSMRYSGVAGISNAELVAAAARVKTEENSGFADWLSDWAPWNAFVEKQYPDEYEDMKLRKNEIADELLEKMDAEVAAEIEQMIEAGALPKEKTNEAARARNDVDVRLSNEKWRRIAPKAMHLAMQEFVNKLGHAGIMDPRWPSAA